MTSKRASVLLVGGLEPSGRVGLLADIATCLELDARPLAIASSLTAQQATPPRSHVVDAQIIRRQMKGLPDDVNVQILKSGVVPELSVLKLLSRHVFERGWLWVVDPVVRSSSGLRLSNLTARDFLALGRLGAVLTPNLDELSWLMGKEPHPRHMDEAVDDAKSLISLGFSAVVVKGGHALDAPVDLVCTAKERVFLRTGGRLKRTPRHRGTGCRFATALAVKLAQGSTISQSAEGARRYVRHFLKQPHERMAF